ncbi:MAG: TraR/DksA family transcriptional regulator [Halieaceae bacterium]|nr:TraR/DksA family transcriptional regulator [Halieaceae bacterium]
MDKDQRHAALRQRLGELEGRLAGVTRDITKTLSSDFAEQATERENDDVLEEIARETQISIHHLKAALQRLDDGSYGICVSCGEDISAARLRVIPEATLCVNCAD